MPPQTDDVLWPSRLCRHAALCVPVGSRAPWAAAQVLSLAGFLHEPELRRIPTSPPPSTRENVAHIKQLYRDAQCDSCHSLAESAAGGRSKNRRAMRNECSSGYASRSACSHLSATETLAWRSGRSPEGSP
jgi:hypothetical protein